MAKKRSMLVILKFLMENPDTDKMRNTLTRLKERLPDIPRSTIHSQLKSLVNRGYLFEESDEIISTNNQPMKIIRYGIIATKTPMVRELIDAEK